MIVITGATGTVGSTVVRALKDAGVSFLAMVRDPEKGRRVLGSDVDIIYGDYTKPDSLDTAFREATKVFLVSPSNEFQIQMENNVVDAAVRAGVDHLVKLSVMGASPYANVQFFRAHYLVERHIIEMALSYTFLRPNTFMQNLLGMSTSVVSDGKFYGSLGEGKVSFIDVRDIASVAATALTNDQLVNTTFDLTGPTAVSYPDIARILSQALGRSVEYVDIPSDVQRKSFLDMGLPEWRADDYVEFQRLMRMNYGAVVTSDASRVMGRTPISFDEFARDYAQAFLQARVA